jgi:hypothetical protein
MPFHAIGNGLRCVLCTARRPRHFLMSPVARVALCCALSRRPFAVGSALADVLRGVSSTVLAGGSAHVAPAVAACVFLSTVGAAVVNFRRQDIG